MQGLTGERGEEGPIGLPVSVTWPRSYSLLEKSWHWSQKHIIRGARADLGEVCSVQQRWHRGTARIRPPAVQQSIDISYPPGPTAANCVTGCKRKKVSKRSIAVSDSPHRYGNSHAIWDHTALPATRQRWHSRLYLSRSWYSIKRHRSWLSWLITTRDGIPARRRSPIPVVTGPDVR